MDFSMDKTVLTIGKGSTELIQQVRPKEKDEERESMGKDRKPKKMK